MNKAIKQKWLKALRSDEYAQGKTWLCRDIDGEHRFCCLGVLVNGVEGFEKTPSPTPVLGVNVAAHVVSMNHFPSTDFLEKVGLDEELAMELAQMNDDGRTFRQIARTIEAKA